MSYGTIVASDALSPLRGFYGGYIPTGVDTPAYSVSPFGLINPILCLIHSLRA